MRKLIIPIILVATMLGQAPPSSRKQTSPAKSGVDTIIELVQGGASESTVIKSLRSQGAIYKLSPDDLLKLQKAGVSESIINVMTDPKTSVAPVAPSSVQQPAPAEIAAAKGPSLAGAAATPAPAPPAEAVTTPYPPDLEGMQSAVHKRRVVVAAFDYSAIKETLQGYYQGLGLLARLGYIQGADPSHATDDVGQGIRAMIMSRLQQANVVTVLERNAAIDIEQRRGVSAQIDPGSRTKMGYILGADCIVTGDITIFGRDDKIKHKGGGGEFFKPWKGWGFGALGETQKEEKAVVGVEFRIVDSETSEVILTANARGESVRKSKSLGIEGLGIGAGGAGGGGFESAMTSSGFEKTILGEATIDAVNQIVKQLDEKIPQLPARPRSIEGRVASITAAGACLALGKNDGVLLGDRFEIAQIKNEVLDPQTKEVISVEADKVGELVVNKVEEKAAFGNYGGQPLSADYVTALGKGYQARLMSK